MNIPSPLCTEVADPNRLKFSISASIGVPWVLGLAFVSSDLKTKSPKRLVESSSERSKNENKCFISPFVYLLRSIHQDWSNGPFRWLEIDSEYQTESIGDAVSMSFCVIFGYWSIWLHIAQLSSSASHWLNNNEIIDIILDGNSCWIEILSKLMFVEFCWRSMTHETRND